MAGSFCPGQKVLEEFARGQVSEAAARDIRQHVQGCARCTALVHTLASSSIGDVPARTREPGTVADGQQVARPARDQTEALDLDSTRTLPASASPVASLEEKDTVSEDCSFLAPPRSKDEIGRLAHYRILKILGEGGMGMVFQAEDTLLQRLVALKVIRPDRKSTEVSRRRFMQEARAAASVQHNHIVPIFQVGEDRNVQFLAMQFLKGETLGARLSREGALPVHEVLRIGREMAEGLAAAHEQGLIHRDIKPANIWLESSKPGQPGWVRILDFGLARATNPDAPQLTRSGVVVGTPGFMAPEQARGGTTLDERCDLFSLGCVLYTMSTGQEPFQGDDVMSTLMALALEDPIPIREINPRIPSDLVALVDELLAKKPEKRPSSASAVIDRLAAIEKALGPADSASQGPDPLQEEFDRVNARLAQLAQSESAEPDGEAISTDDKVAPAGETTERIVAEATSEVVLSGNVCPTCKGPLSRLGWCLACGYYPEAAREEAEAPPLAARSIDLTWVWLLLAGCVALFALSYAASIYLPKHSGLRRWLGTGEIALGVITLILAHLWALILSLPHRHDHHGVFDYFDPFRLYYYAFKLLPTTRRPLQAASWGLTAALCALFLVGGFWQVKPPAPIRPVVVGQVVAAMERMQDLTDAEETDLQEAGSDADTDIDGKDEGQRLRAACVVIGYVPGPDNSISKLVLATRQEGGLTYAGLLDAGLDKHTDALQALLNPSLAEPEAPIKDVPVKAIWLKPTITCEVEYQEVDIDKTLIDPILLSISK